MPLEGKGVYARWDADDRSLRVYTSTQAATSVRAAIAAKLGLALPKVEVIAPDVGGGFGSRSCTRGRRRSWCRWPRCGSAAR